MFIFFTLLLNSNVLWLTTETFACYFALNTYTHITYPIKYVPDIAWKRKRETH